MEHIGRYEGIYKFFNNLGANVYGNDHFGHGDSGPYKKEDPQERIKYVRR
jgi:alpha-beta hydrolase superfamily lysophospholipase